MDSRLTRAHFLEQSALAALSAAGLYGLVDGIAARPARALATPHRLPAEQHLLGDVRVVAENGVEVVVPPLHHQIVTARLDVGGRKAELLDAQRALEAALTRIERTYAPTAAGLGVTVGWGRSYFRHRVPSLAGGRRFPDYLPVDRRASRAAGKPRPGSPRQRSLPERPRTTSCSSRTSCACCSAPTSLEHIVRRDAAPIQGVERAARADEHPQRVRRRRGCRSGWRCARRSPAPS